MDENSTSRLVSTIPFFGIIKSLFRDNSFLTKVNITLPAWYVFCPIFWLMGYLVYVGFNFRNYLLCGESDGQYFALKLFLYIFTEKPRSMFAPSPTYKTQYAPTFRLRCFRAFPEIPTVTARPNYATPTPPWAHFAIHLINPCVILTKAYP